FETLQPFFGHARLAQRFIKALQVTIAAEEFQIALTNDDIVRSGIVVELLMPLFQKVSSHLLDMMAVHDIQNLVSDPLSLAASAKTRQHRSHQWPPGGLLCVKRGDLASQPLLRVA